MQNNKQNTLTFSVLSASYIILGLFLLLAPVQSQLITCYLLGGVGVVLGIIRFVSYFMRDKTYSFLSNDLALGVTLITVGVYAIAKPDVLTELLPVILGFAIIYGGMIKLQHAFDLRKIGFVYWWVVLMLALATTTLGLILIMDIFGDGALAIYFGIVLIVDGLLNLAILLLVMFQRKGAQAKARHDGRPLDIIEDPVTGQVISEEEKKRR